MSDHNHGRLEFADLHLISTPGKATIVFDPLSLALFRTDPAVGAILQDYAIGRSLEDLSAAHGQSTDAIRNLLSQVREATRTTQNSPAQPTDTRRMLGKIVLNISNSCNLRCRYCYAQGGSYGKEPAFMSEETARRALDCVFGTWNEVRGIMLFGGEPCLNIAAIREVCQHLDFMCQSGRLAKAPMLGMVSNGTLVTKELISLINAYHISVTISLDGPEIVNDLLRLTHTQC